MGQVVPLGKHISSVGFLYENHVDHDTLTPAIKRDHSEEEEEDDSAIRDPQFVSCHFVHAPLAGSLLGESPLVTRTDKRQTCVFGQA